jgi:glycosyltransferase involved in cell wall biosynthesis
MNAPPLRILQVNSRFNGGGVDNQTLDLSAGLLELGDTVTMAVATGSRWEPRARQLGARVETYPARSPLQSAAMRCWIQLIRQHDIEILHAHQGNDYWPAILAARLSGRSPRVVITRHLMTRPRFATRWALLRLADMVAVSRAVELVLRRELHGPAERIHRIHCGIQAERFLESRNAEVWQYREQNGWPADAIVFGVVGGFVAPRGKGQPEFLDAAARIRERIPAARFAIIGEGSMESALRNQISLLGLGGVARIIPFSAAIPVVMSALDVLVHPAVGTEALGLVTIEALASGRPVIASNLDGIPESFIEGEHGLLVPPGDVDALAQAMERLGSDAALRQRMGATGRAHVCANFSRQVLARRTHDLYAQLLARGGRSRT